MLFDRFLDDSRKNYHWINVFLKIENCDLNNVINVMSCFDVIYFQFYQYIDRSLGYTCPVDLSFPGIPFLLWGLKS